MYVLLKIVSLLLLLKRESGEGLAPLDGIGDTHRGEDRQPARGTQLPPGEHTNMKHNLIVFTHGAQ